MLRLSLLLSSLALLRTTQALPGVSPDSAANTACQAIQGLSFQPEVLIAMPGSQQYQDDLWFAASSVAQNATCTVQPRNSQELLSILNVIKKKRTPWAVKGRGHNFNKGFASTTGVQISLGSMKSFSYDAKTQTATYGAGNAWSDVYPQLEANGVIVVGGRGQGVGVAGVTTGGGIGYKSNQYGLSSDNVVQFELVTYTGQILNVTSTSYPDLFWGLQGGMNNFGIVTKFTVRTFAQSKIQASFLQVKEQDIPAFAQAIVKYTNYQKDVKSSLNPAFSYAGGKLSAFAFLVYDSPMLPMGVFDDFKALGAVFNQTTLTDYVGYSSSLATGPPTREQSQPASLTNYNIDILNWIINTTVSEGKKAAEHSATAFIMTPESFLPSAYAHGSDSGRDSAYPHSMSQPWNPVWIGATWTDPAEDEWFTDLTYRLGNELQAFATKYKLSSPDALLYPNYANKDTPLERMYGKNVPRLRSLAKKWDPSGLRKLTGGFLF